MKELIIDANNAILGRLASYAAKQSLLGKKVIILNCANAVLSGRKGMIVGEYKEAVKRGGSSMKGPFFPRTPYQIVKRTIRGMLASQQQRGRDALKRIICYNNIPKEYENAKKLIAGKDKNVRTIKLADIAKEL